MATLAAGLAGGGLGKALYIGGTILSGVSRMVEGRAQGRALDYEARQRDEAAKAETAAAIQESNEVRREARLVMSRARAMGAASGGGRALDVEAEIFGEGERRALFALWGGEERARDQRSRAAVNRYEAGQARRAGRIGGLKTLAEGGATFYERYG